MTCSCLRRRHDFVAHCFRFHQAQPKSSVCSFASGGEAEPSPPWQDCRDAPSLSHRHPASVWSRLARQTFRLAPLSSPARRASHGIPPVLECPPRPGGQHLASVSGKRRHHRSPSMDGAAPTIQRHCARRMVCASLQSSICRASEHVAPYARAPASVRTIFVLRCIDTGPLRDFWCFNDDDFCQGGTYTNSYPGDVAFERGQLPAHQAGRRCGGGRRESLDEEQRPFVAPLDTRKLAYYRALEAEHRQPVVLSDIAKGPEDVLPGRVRLRLNSGNQLEVLTLGTAFVRITKAYGGFDENRTQVIVPPAQVTRD